MPGVLKLYRTPLRKGEVPYHLLRVHTGVGKDGQPLPRAVVQCQVLPDGRLSWELPDLPENRAMIENHYSGPGPGGSRYSHEFPGKAAEAAKAPAKAVAPAVPPVVASAAPAAPAPVQPPAAAQAAPPPPSPKRPPPKPRGKTPAAVAKG